MVFESNGNTHTKEELELKKQLVYISCCIMVVTLLMTTSAFCAPSLDQVERIKFLSNNMLPHKVLVVLSYGNSQFVKELFNVIKRINEGDRLSGDELIKLHIVSTDSNPARTLGISAADAKKYLEVNKRFSSSDIWMQDCMELCSAKVKGASGFVPAVFDSRRGRGLGRLPATLAQMWDLVYFRNPSGSQAHGDYGGNLEVAPFDDVLITGSRITSACKNYLDKHGYANRHFYPNTDWLTVGHIDEYLSFIPTPTAPGGYTIVKADPDYALELIQNLPDSEFDNISSYDKRFLLEVKRVLNEQMKYPEAGKNTEAGQFIALNRSISDIIDDSVGRMKEYIRKVSKEPNRDFEEVAWPSLFEGSGTTNPHNCHAYLPGVVNLLVVRDHLIVPAIHIPAFDKIIMARLRAQGNKVHFIDDTPYHNSMGEIHCGTNVLRDPNKSFVTKAQVKAVRAVREKFEAIHRAR